MFGEAVIHDITAVQHKVWAQGEDSFGAAACDFRIALGVTQDSKRPGEIRTRKGLERENVAARHVAVWISGADAVKVGGVWLKVRELDLTNRQRIRGASRHREGLSHRVFDLHG